ncbi:MAG: pseudouridine synthase [Bacteroidia bacterium]
MAISNKEAKLLIESGQVKINDQICLENEFIYPLDEIEVNGNLIQSIHSKTFFILNKPKGIECTLNPQIPENLLSFLPVTKDIFHVGRLDKESQGLMLFSNEGKIHDKILRNQHNPVLKKYLVKINQIIHPEFIQKMESGIEILGTVTEPCKLQQLDQYSFFIWLNQGLNRQIRRMCYQLGAEVLFLERHEIGEIKLNQLPPGQTRDLLPAELLYIKSLFRN